MPVTRINTPTSVACFWLTGNLTVVVCRKHRSKNSAKSTETVMYVSDHCVLLLTVTSVHSSESDTPLSIIAKSGGYVQDPISLFSKPDIFPRSWVKVSGITAKHKGPSESKIVEINLTECIWHWQCHTALVGLTCKHFSSGDEEPEKKKQHVGIPSPTIGIMKKPPKCTIVSLFMLSDDILIYAMAKKNTKLEETIGHNRRVGRGGWRVACHPNHQQISSLPLVHSLLVHICEQFHDL